MRKYKLNEEYFNEIDTEEKAYWLGFIYADGNIYNNILCINLADRDSIHNHKFKKSIEYEGPLYSSLSNFNTGVSRCQIGSKRIIEGLRALGIIENKSITQVPIVLENNQLQKHFWRGVFDGDGDITRIYNKNGQMYWRIRLTGNIATVEGFNRFIKNNLQLDGIIRDHGSVKRIEFNKSKYVKDIMQLLYTDSSIYLDRKFVLAQDILSKLVST